MLKYTYYGDANLDGTVDGFDYAQIDSTYLSDQSSSAAATGWFNGDFNYDGTVNGSDYTLIDNVYNQQGAAISAQVAGAVGFSVQSTVPEPVAGWAFSATVAVLIRRGMKRGGSGL